MVVEAAIGSAEWLLTVAVVFLQHALQNNYKLNEKICSVMRANPVRPLEGGLWTGGGEMGGLERVGV